ncbi:hypothetical protein [Rhizobium laguerreae]|uniref:hypothetical protein n=1 Tax=Rhizobium laguerreae TaxID=1076926 RepID=UPI001C91D436|nr:hypothetical protein [Rhizobium laguerreae]MBY3386306.1 hypothetical protein [Rhizobium laguerreae]MBY3400389.1 hypothetical protein [Rhizobium laguerreae]MBY3407326.1 hypothetical protein [Rhizobium laguerreae]
MGVWETDTYNVAACPCGKGHVQRIVETPDNGWSRTNESYELACADCEKAWEISSYSGTLTDRQTRKESGQASAVSQAASAAVVEYLNSLLPSWPFPSFKTQGTEFEYLSVKGLYEGTVGQYRYQRRAQTLHDIAEVGAHSSIVPELVKKVGGMKKYESLVAEAKTAKQTADTKYKAIKYISLPQGK